MSAATQVRQRLARVDPALPLLGLVSLVTFVLHGFSGALGRDPGVYAYAGQQVADGVPAYVGILNRAGPLAHLIPAIGVGVARVTGHDDLLGTRVLYMLISVGCVCLAYLAARDLFASRIAGVSSATALLSFAGFITYATYGPREKTPMMLFLLYAFWALTKKRWLTAGLFVGLATLVLQIAFFVGAPILAVAVLTAEPGRRLRATARMIVGGLLSAVACLVYFVAVGAVHVAVDAFVVINSRYTTATTFTSHLSTHVADLRKGYGFSLLVLVVGLAALIALALPALRSSSRRNDPSVVLVAAFAVGCLGGLLWTLHDFDNWPDVFPLLPLAAIGMGGLVKTLAARLTRPLALGITAAWLVVSMALAVTFSVAHRNHMLVHQRHSVVAVLAQLPGNATILSLRAPQALVLSGRTNPTRYQMFSSGLNRYVDDTYPGGLAGFGRWIGRQRPTLIAVGVPKQPWMGPLLSTDYRRIGSVKGWIWFADKSLGPSTLAALRHASAHPRAVIHGH
jgi:4-amino-4-deoxy-L-arabinose transferase-like glycosyltransferase